MAHVTTQKKRSGKRMQSAMEVTHAVLMRNISLNLVGCTELMRSHTPQESDESYLSAETRLSREIQLHIVQIRVPI